MQTNNSENNWTELKILEPIKKYLKEFNTPDEFNLWYSKHKNEVDNETTHKLNKMYHINGYRITKIKGILMLKKWDNTKSVVSSANDTKNDSNKENDEIIQQINEMKEAINSIIKFLNQQTTVVSPPLITSTKING